MWPHQRYPHQSNPDNAKRLDPPPNRAGIAQNVLLLAVATKIPIHGVELPNLANEIGMKAEAVAREPRTRLRRNQKHQQAVVTHYVQKWKHANTIRCIHRAPTEEKLASPVFSDDPLPRDHLAI